MANEKQVIQGWKDVQITPDMPLNVLVNFMNVLNQRLVALEDNVQVPFDNKMVSLTELYAIQAEAERKAMEEQAKVQAELAKQKDEKGE